MSDSSNGSTEQIFPDSLASALLNHPLDYIIPKQSLIPFSAPFDVWLAEEKIPVSANEVTKQGQKVYDKTLESEILESFVTTSDLENLTFKKQAMRFETVTDLAFPCEPEKTKAPMLEEALLSKISPVSKRQLTRPRLKVKRIRLNASPTSHEIQQVVDSSIGMDSDTQNTHRHAHSSQTDSFNDHDIPQINAHQSSDAHIDAMEFQLSSLLVLEQTITSIGMLDEDFDFDNQKYWSPYSTSSDEYTYLLNLETFSSLEENMRRLWYKGQLNELKIDLLVRINDLALRSLNSCQEVSWTLHDLSKTEAEKVLMLALNCCKASVLAMLTFTSGREEKQLYLVTHLKSVFEFVFNFGEELITLQTGYEITFPAAEILHLNNVVREFVKVLDLIAFYAQNIPMEDNVLTKLEFFCLKLIFVNVDPKVGHPIPEPSFDRLRLSVSNIIHETYHKNPEQRQFIMNEIVNNFDKLLPHKTHSRQIRLARGVSVQLVTLLIVRLIQSVSLADYQFGDSYWLILDQYTSKKKKQFAELSTGVRNYIQDVTKETSETCNEIASTLLSRIAANPDLNNRKVLENFIEDLLLMLTFDEYPACEPLLESLMNTLMFVFSSEKYASQVEAFALEMIGLMGTKIIVLKKKQNYIKFGPETSISDYRLLLKSYLTVLQSLRFDNKVEKNSYNFLITRLLMSTMSLRTRIESISEENPLTAPPSMAQIESLTEVCELKLLKSFNDQQLVLYGSDFQDVDVDHDYLQVLQSQNFFAYYESFVSLIVKSLDHPKTKSRNRAVKNLSLLINRDPSLLTIPVIKDSISARLIDTHASVRDSVLELLMTCVSKHPEIIDDYYAVVCERLNDSSTSVRKKAIHLSVQIYRSSKRIEVKARISERLLRRMDDEEDNIVDLATSQILDLWFMDVFIIANGVHISSAMELARVWISVTTSGDKNWDYFERFFKEKVVHPTPLNQKLRTEINSSLLLVVQDMLTFVTNNVHEEKLRPKIESATGLLAILVKCDGSLLSQDQLVSLQPYLTDDSSTGSSLCYYILQVFRHTLPQMVALKQSFVSQCEGSLLSRLTKFNAKELDEAMPCLWLLSILKKDTVKLARACLSSIMLIRPYLSKIKEPGYRPDNKLQRLLFLLGNFGRYCKLDEHKNLFTASKLNMKQNETISGFLIKHLLLFCDKNLDPSLKRVATKNLINVCISHPSYFMSEQILSVMDEVFDNSGDLYLQDIVINGLSTFLELEEKEAIARNGLENKDSKKVKLDVQVFHGESTEYVNDGICSSLAQRYLNPVLNTCLIEESEHCLRAVSFLRLIVKLGFANPKLCIPTIVALEASQSPAVRSVAMAMHEDLFEKYESLIETGYTEGLKLAVRYRKKYTQDLFAETSLMKCMVSVIGSSKSALKKLIKVILRSFNMIDPKKSVEELKFVIDFIGYMTVNLSSIVLYTQEQVLMLVCGLDKLVAVEGTTLMELIDSQDEVDWYRMSLIARPILTLIKLRQYLSLSYSITDAKIEKYQESINSKDFKTHITKSDWDKLHIADLDLGLRRQDEDFQKILCLKLRHYLNNDSSI